MIEATKNVNQTIKHLKLNLHNEQLLNADNLQLTQVRPTVLNDLNSYNYYLLFLSFFFLIIRSFPWVEMEVGVEECVK